MNGLWFFGSGSLRSSHQESLIWHGELVLHFMNHTFCGHPASSGSHSRSHDAEDQQPFLASLVQRHEHVCSALLFHSTSLTFGQDEDQPEPHGYIDSLVGWNHETEVVTGVNAELCPTCQYDGGVQVLAVVEIAQ